MLVNKEVSSELQRQSSAAEAVQHSVHKLELSYNF